MSIALVSGVNGGIGHAIARQLHRDGHTVVVTDQPGAAFDTRLSESGFDGYPCDLGNAQQVEQLVACLSERHPMPSIVVNAAGGVRSQTGIALEHVSAESWRQIFAANVDSAFNLAQHCLPAMRDSGNGRFITISSGAGLKPSLTGIQAYTAAKHALVGLTKQLAMEFGPHGVTVNSVAPGFVLSNEATKRQWQSYGETGQQQLIDRIYTRKLGQPEDIAHAVSFLASDKAQWITGQVLQVDGGTS